MSTQTNCSKVPLQLLLFIDKRPSSGDKNRQIQEHLEQLRQIHDFDLQVIDVGEQPHLAEHFKLVATPTLVKIYPEPRQTLAGSNLIAQVETWWPRWQQSLEDSVGLDGDQPAPPLQSLNQYSEILKLTDEIFRLRQEMEELQAQLQFKERLIAMLAHDLRNPLTAVSIALETLEMGLDPQQQERYVRMTPEMMSQLLRHARTQSKAIDRMITDILQAARTTSSQLQIQPQKLNLGELCLEILDRLSNQSESKMQHLKVDIPSDLPLVFADPDRVRQVIINLLDNAIKYTPTGGTIEVSALHRTTQKVQVSVCDTGPGIPAENRERIFEDRFRLERDEATEGYGIGLALCQRIVKAHYGQIWVDSELGRGSCFHFTLPVFRI
ncbi:MAG TPA: histidine kinase [Synechococcales cyanobacterium M55_K2018_004]|nr:histidine kinase [Synechococcales cyanobacterium M55_K2018_004]